MQQALLKEQNEILAKYKDREVPIFSIFSVLRTILYNLRPVCYERGLIQKQHFTI